LISFTRRKRGLPSRCAFVFSQEVAVLTEDEDENITAIRQTPFSDILIYTA